MLGKRGERCRVSDRRSASVADKEVAGEHPQGGNPDRKERRDPNHASAAEGQDAAISAWIAEERNRISGRELGGEEGKFHGGVASAARNRGLNACKESKLF